MLKITIHFLLFGRIRRCRKRWQWWPIAGSRYFEFALWSQNWFYCPRKTRKSRYRHFLFADTAYAPELTSANILCDSECFTSIQRDDPINWIWWTHQYLLGWFDACRLRRWFNYVLINFMSWKWTGARQRCYTVFVGVIFIYNSCMKKWDKSKLAAAAVGVIKTWIFYVIFIEMHSNFTAYTHIVSCQRCLFNLHSIWHCGMCNVRISLIVRLCECWVREYCSNARIVEQILWGKKKKLKECDWWILGIITLITLASIQLKWCGAREERRNWLRCCFPRPRQIYFLFALRKYHLYILHTYPYLYATEPNQT